MRKVLFFLTPLILAAVVFSIFMLFYKTTGKGALQVTSLPKSKVFLNGNLIGETPLCKCEGTNTLDEGEYNIKLVDKDGQFPAFEEKITISKSVLTVVDRTFGQGAMSEASVINLTPLEDKKVAQLSVVSFPDKTQVFVDSVLSGETPTLLKNLTQSDHEVRIVKNGYKEKAIRIRTIPGFKLTILAFLGIDPDVLNLNPTSSVLPSGNATPSASISPSLSLSPSLSSVQGGTKIIILQTPTGFLRVREDASISSAEIARVNPDEIFDLIEEKVSWFKIKLTDGKEGWISSQYAKKQ